MNEYEKLKTVVRHQLCYLSEVQTVPYWSTAGCPSGAQISHFSLRRPLEYWAISRCFLNDGAPSSKLSILHPGASAWAEDASVKPPRVPAYAELNNKLITNNLDTTKSRTDTKFWVRWTHLSPRKVINGSSFYKTFVPGVLNIQWRRKS